MFVQNQDIADIHFSSATSPGADGGREREPPAPGHVQHLRRGQARNGDGLPLRRAHGRIHRLPLCWRLHQATKGKTQIEDATV